MYHKVADSVKCYAAGDKKQIIESTLNTKIKKHNTWNGKNDKENIITLKSMFVFGLMMICVKIPHESVHNILVCKPGHTFHEQENP